MYVQVGDFLTFVLALSLVPLGTRYLMLPLNLPISPSISTFLLGFLALPFGDLNIL